MKGYLARVEWETLLDSNPVAFGSLQSYIQWSFERVMLYHV